MMKANHVLLNLVLSTGLMSGAAFAQSQAAPAGNTTQAQLNTQSTGAETADAPAGEISVPEGLQNNGFVAGSSNQTHETAEGQTATSPENDRDDGDGVNQNLLWLLAIVAVLSIFMYKVFRGTRQNAVAGRH